MARKAIRDADLAVLVEGYMDVLMSHQVGVSNVVAGMGTALGETQMRQLKRYTSNLTLALDPDAAGDHATLRGLEAARQSLEREWEPVISPTGLVRQESRLKAQLRIAALPDGLDPDELAHADVDRWRQVIADARPIVDYYLTLVGREEDLSTARGKANAVERMAPLIRGDRQPGRTRPLHPAAGPPGPGRRTAGGRAGDGSGPSRQQTARRAREDTSGAERVGANCGRTAGTRSSAVVVGPGGTSVSAALLLRPDLLAQLDARDDRAAYAAAGAGGFRQRRKTGCALASCRRRSAGRDDRSRNESLAEMPARRPGTLRMAAGTQSSAGHR